MVFSRVFSRPVTPARPAENQNHDPHGHIEHYIWLFGEVRLGEERQDGKEDCSHQQTQHGSGCGLMPSCQFRLGFWGGWIQPVQSSFRNYGLIAGGVAAGVDAVGAAPLVAFLVFGSLCGIVRWVGATGVVSAGSVPL